MPIIAETLKFAAYELQNVTDIPQLEAEILLAHVLNVSRSYLHTYPEKIIDESSEKKFLSLIEKRKHLEPLAYLIGHREFWSLDLIVTPDVLIPRPETELLVELILQNITTDHAVIADLGTGSGAIALALAHEKPNWIIHATDKSEAALSIAKQNAENLSLRNIIFHQGEWCSALPDIKFDAIVSNPPYVAENEMSDELIFEPRSALVAEENGLKDLSQIILQSKKYLKPNGILFLEHGFQQAASVKNIFEKNDYTHVDMHQDLAGRDRVTSALHKI